MKRLIKKIRQNKKSNIWNLTDTIIKIKDIVEDQLPEFSSKFDISESFTCLRDMNNTNIYIKPEDLDKFKDIRLIYDINSDFVNLSILKRYTISGEAYSVIANRAVPPAVNIKFVWYCNIMDINLYIETVYRLPQRTRLFKDLLNFQGLKDIHNLN